jgi:2-C-methyl-D-erythritol 4-phosphate cytidylyltransferase
VTGHTAVVIPAAGRGERLGPGAPKALRLLGGAPLLLHAVRSMAAAGTVDLVVVAAPPGEVDGVWSLLPLDGLRAELRVVEGGATRRLSVARALAALDGDVDVVLVHDAARPLAPPELAEAVARAVRGGSDAVVPALPVPDTIKRVDDTDHVVETVPRAALRAVQTPQGFRRSVLERAHAAATGDDEATDDAGLVEALGVRVRVLPGSDDAAKVTRPGDLLRAESLLARRRAGGVS